MLRLSRCASLTHAPYSHQDFSQVREFIVDNLIRTGGPQEWEFTRWEMWRYTYASRKDDTEFFSRNCRIWRDDAGAIVGFFISEHGKEDAFVIPRAGTPETQDVAEIILDWALGEWGKGRRPIECCAYSQDETMDRLLAGRGFRSMGLYGHAWEYDLVNTRYRPELASGFRVAGIAEIPDLKERCEVVSDAYNGNTTSFDIEEYRWRCSAPGYCPDFDVSLVSPDGVFLSCCTGWIDWRSRMAVVETVGTRRAYQNKGHARNVIAECFRRLAAAGAEKAFISSFSQAAHRTYGSLSPVRRHDLYRYVLE